MIASRVNPALLNAAGMTAFLAVPGVDPEMGGTWQFYSWRVNGAEQFRLAYRGEDGTEVDCEPGNLTVAEVEKINAFFGADLDLTSASDVLTWDVARKGLGVTVEQWLALLNSESADQFGVDVWDHAGVSETAARAAYEADQTPDQYLTRAVLFGGGL